VTLTAEQGVGLSLVLAALFFAVSVVFVWRSFYAMRIREERPPQPRPGALAPSRGASKSSVEFLFGVVTGAHSLDDLIRWVATPFWSGSSSPRTGLLVASSCPAIRSWLPRGSSLRRAVSTSGGSTAPDRGRRRGATSVG